MHFYFFKEKSKVKPYYLANKFLSFSISLSNLGYNTYDTEISTFVCKLYRREYRGTNFSEFARIVQAQYGVEASRSTIYNFLRRGHIRSPQRKTKKKKVVVVENATGTTTPATKKATTTKSK